MSLVKDTLGACVPARMAPVYQMRADRRQASQNAETKLLEVKCDRFYENQTWSA